MQLPEELMSYLFRATFLLSLAALVSWCGLRLLSVRSPRIHQLTWSLVLLHGWLIPLFSWELAILPDEKPVNEIFVDVEKIAVPTSTKILDRPVAQTPHVPQVDSLDIELATSSIGQRHLESISVVHVLGIIWLCGMSIVVLAAVASYTRFVWKLRSLSPTTKSDWETDWKIACREVGCSTDVELMVSDDIGPVLCRTPSRYCLIIPVDRWRDLTTVQRQAVFRHEAAHLKRFDIWKSLVVRLVALPHWFNPLAWLACNRFDESAEWSCDEMTHKNQHSQQLEYSRALLLLGSGHPTPRLASAATGGHLACRVRRILKTSNRKESSMKKSVLVFVMLLTGVMSLSQFTLVADETEGDAEADRNRSKVTEEYEKKIDAVFGSAPPPLRQEPAAKATNDDAADLLSASDLGTEIITSPNAVLPSAFANVKRAMPTKQSERASREAVVDISYVFKQSTMLKRQTDALKKQMKAQDEWRKSVVAQSRRISEQIKQAKPGTDLYRMLEASIAQKHAAVEAYRKVSQHHLLRDESAIYLTTFNRIRGIISAYTKEKGIRVVRRQESTRELDERIKSGDRQAIMQLMNHRVLYVDDSVLDITDEVVKRLKAEEKQCEADATTDLKPAGFSESQNDSDLRISR